MTVLALTHLGYLIAGWGIPIVAFASYALLLVRRGRNLGAQVPEDRQRWISSND